MADAQKLSLMADKLRVHSLKATTAAGSGHPTTCLSCAEIMSSLFFSELQENDEFVLSKGHAAPILWACYAEAGMIPVKELMNLRKISSVLEGHPTPRMRMVKVATGSLGQGLSAAIGMALAKRLRRDPGRVYVLMGDGEIAEGSVWESANTASYHNLTNLCAIVDINRLGQSQETMHGHDLERYRAKFEAFGWDAFVIDGHDIKSITSTFDLIRQCKRPAVILAKTLKGKGVSFIENKEGWHGKALSSEELSRALRELENPETTSVKMPSRIRYKEIKCSVKDFPINKYSIGDMVATREAFGNALLNLGRASQDVVAIDADVRNSTMMGSFFKEFPERSFQSFIAEQSMAGMAIGFASMGYAPFMSTFAAFLTRAHDFMRMAVYSRSNMKIAGSHCGVSIGEDGPSQMGLEDISMFLSMPGSTILYPCDAVSAESCTKELAKHRGICYLRNTRAKTPVIYRNREKFPIGGLKVLRKSAKDRALVIAAGITVHEALKAYDALKKKNISIRVIDLYSVQPADGKAIMKNIRECKGNVVVVEDHYFGGIGSVVSGISGSITRKMTHLFIKDIPQSGKPEELMKRYGIGSDAIIKAVKAVKNAKR